MNDSIELTPELLNDFFAECEEHLNIIRQSLVALEKGGDSPESASLLDKLFRSFHSLKGIVGMAGLRPAEQLAHRTEDYLRQLTSGQKKPSPQGVDILAGAVLGMEQSVGAFRQQHPFPDLTHLLKQFDALLSSDESPPEVGAKAERGASPPPLADGLRGKANEARARGLSIWKATFTPSPELKQRGINVNAIRQRLTAAGEIIQAATDVRAGGAIAFEYFLMMRDPPLDLASWREAGVTFSQIMEGDQRDVPAIPAPLTLAAAPSQVIRVDLRRLDDLMRIAGELVIQRARLEQQINLLSADKKFDARGIQEVNLGLARDFKDLRETVMRLRMVPIAEIFDRMPFVVRDLARGTNKQVKLEIQGQSTELDKYVVERLKDPLLHLVRNAVSHGIEDAGKRAEQGKRQEATLTLSASTAGETVIIEIADDGQGIDPREVVRRAREMGLHTSDNPDDAALLDLISVAGFSTREEADRVAGRGVGMNVVVNTLRELGGSLFLKTKAGQGTRFTLRLPLTLLITDALIISSGGQNFAVPQNSVEEVVQVEEVHVKRMENAELLSLRGAVLPLVRLRAAFGFPPHANSHSPVLVSQSERGKVGLVVDRIVGQRQIVVRSLRDPLIHVPGVVGATELGDGRPLLILDAGALARQNETRSSAATLAANKTKHIKGEP